MIKRVDPSLPSTVHFVLWAMGHGDEVAVVDSHFMTDWDEEGEMRCEIVQIDGMNSPRAVRAILTALQLDTNFVDYPVKRLEDVRSRPVLEVQREVQKQLNEALGFPCPMAGVPYREFRELAKNCYALIVTGDPRRQGSFILRKGLDVTPESVCRAVGR
jgi:L-fucose mutarotase